MKKILLLFSLLLCISLQGQIPRYPFYVAPSGTTVDSASWTAQYKAVYYHMADPPALATAEYQDNLVDSLHANGYWDRMDLLYVMAQHSEADAKLMWINPTAGTYDLVETGAGNLGFTENEGFTGDSVNYLTTGWDQGTNGVNYHQYDATIAIYTRLNDHLGTNVVIGNSPTSGSGSRIILKENNAGTPTFYSRVNAGSSLAAANSDTRGFFMSTNRSITDKEAYKNGSSVATLTSSVSWAASTYDFYILANNYIGTAASFCDNQVSIAIIMDKVTDAEATEINTFIEAFMDAIGKGVQ
jgi:hypothetical protein